MKIELSLHRDRYALDESIELRVVLHNDTDAAVRVPDPLHNDNWQPTYHLEGPEFPDGRRLSARSALTPDARPAPDDLSLSMIELPPGGRHQGEVPLWEWCPVTMPGTYTLQVRLDHEGLTARSETLTLELVSLTVRQVSVGVDEPSPNPAAPGQLWTAFVHEAGAGSALYDAPWTEDRPDLGELERSSLEHRRDLGAEVTAVHVPWSNTDRVMAMSAWRAWTQGDRLFADPSPLAEPFGLEVGASAQVLPPAWQDEREALDVLLLTDEGRRLALARFRSQAPPAPPTAAIAWRSQPRPAMALARMALGPAPAGSPRRAVAVEAAGGDVTLTHFTLDDGDADQPTSAATFNNATVLPGTPLTLRVTPRGHTRAWLLIATGPADRQQIYLGAVEFDARGQHGGGTLHPLITFPGTVVDTALELPLSGPDLDRPVWALLTERGQVLWARGDQPRWQGAERPTAPPRRVLGQAAYLGGVRPVSPMQLRALGQATYLAVLEPGRAPRFITLDG